MMRRLGALALLVGLLVAPGAAVAADRVVVAHHVIVSVGVTAVTARPQNTLRRSIGVVNEGSAKVYCTFDDTTAVAPSGIPLAANGTTGDRVFFDQNVPLGAVSCITATTSTIIVIEGR